MSERYAYLIFGAKYKDVRQTCPHLDDLISDNELDKFTPLDDCPDDGCMVGVIILTEDSQDKPTDVTFNMDTAQTKFIGLTDCLTGAVMLVQDNK